MVFLHERLRKVKLSMSCTIDEERYSLKWPCSTMIVQQSDLYADMSTMFDLYNTYLQKAQTSIKVNYSNG